MHEYNKDLQQRYRRLVEACVNDWISENNTGIAERLHHIASALYRMEAELKVCSELGLARMIHSGAMSIDNISAQVGRGDTRELMELLEQQGRKYPAGALLAGMTAGFLSTFQAGYKPRSAAAGMEYQSFYVEPRHSPAFTRIELRLKE